MSNMTYEEQDPDELTMSYLRGVHDGKKQRTWVGLTEDERTAIREGVAQYHDATGWNYAKAVQQATELKLQEKNS